MIANHNLHSIYLARRDPQMRAYYAAARAAHIDGMALVVWGRLLGYPLRREQRVTYIDWIRPLMAAAARHDWRVFHVGGRPGVGERAAETLRREVPGLQLRTHHGYFDPQVDEIERLLSEIADERPNLLLVGMGMPRQERWVVENLGRLQANVILTCGACFDYLAGVVPTPPRWVAGLGLEWLYRLLSEPRRLWRRYLLEPWALLPAMIEDLRRRR